MTENKCECCDRLNKILKEMGKGKHVCDNCHAELFESTYNDNKIGSKSYCYTCVKKYCKCGTRLPDILNISGKKYKGKIYDVYESYEDGSEIIEEVCNIECRRDKIKLGQCIMKTRIELEI